jgi:hypothetical protein
MSRYLLRPALMLVASLLAACSSFDARWNEAAKGGNGASRWDGHWASGVRKETDGSAHGGRLRCVLKSSTAEKASKLAAKQTPPHLDAYFHANWLIFSGNYELELDPVPGKPHEYRGTHDLPYIFGGTYRYSATVTDDHFTASYICSYDRGIFDLRRVPSEYK